MTVDLDAIRQRLAKDRERYAIGASDLDDRHNLLALVDRQQARIAAMQALRPDVEMALHFTTGGEATHRLLREVLAALGDN